MNKILNNLIDMLNPLFLQQYLSIRGWDKFPSKRIDVFYFRKNLDNHIYEIAVPNDSRFADNNDILKQAINTISKIENREPLHILNDLLLEPSDVVRFRLKNERTEEGLIPLSEGLILFENAKKALLSTACDVALPSLYHTNLGLKNAKKFIDSCMIGQTERGSYVASVVCPIDAQTDIKNYQKFTLFHAPEQVAKSFTRRTTQQLMISIEKLKRAIENNNLDIIENPINIEDTISANFMEALVDISDYGEHDELEIMTTWASNLPINHNIPTSVKITSDYIKPMESMIERIKGEDTEVSGSFVGRISTIHSEETIRTERNGGDITFKFLGDDEKLVKAKVSLNNNDFYEAMDAMREGLNIKIEGLLKISGKTKIIKDPIFHIV